MKHVNAVIVGSGAGGGVVAKELACAGMSVVLLERGKWYSAADCRKDEQQRHCERAPPRVMRHHFIQLRIERPHCEHDDASPDDR